MNKSILYLFVICGSLLFFTSGCTTRVCLDYSVKRDAKYKLDGVSKIGFIDFNALHDLQNKTKAADRESVEMAQKLIAAHFKSNPKYELVDFDIERDISAQGTVRPKTRLDGLLYGQVWYQTTPEFLGVYPKFYELNDTATIFYQEIQKDSSMAPNSKELTLYERDRLETQYFRTKRATAVVTLTLYRLDHNGMMVKVLDLIETQSKVYTMDNGTGEDALTTDLAIKHELVNTAASGLLDQLLPQQINVEIYAEFGGDLKEQFDKSGPREIIDYCIRKIVEESSADVAARIPTLGAYESLIQHNINAKIDNDDILDAIADNEKYLLAIAMCEEAMGKTAQARNTYRMLMHNIEEPEYCREIAAGLARCITILGIKQQYKKDMSKHQETIKHF